MSHLGEGILAAVLILTAAFIADRLLVQFSKRSHQWFEQHLTPSQRSLVEPAWRLLQVLLHVGLWVATLIGVLNQVPILKPLGIWLVKLVQAIPIQLGQVFNTPFRVGSERVTLSILVTFVLATLAIFAISHIFSQWLKRRILSGTRLDRGSQEAISTIISYTLAILGFLIVLQTVGLDLSSLAVLAGVLGIGLGLGLQELASNFVSGLTLLFEQQLRVGDFIDMDGLLGTIERISIRSTVVRTQDQLFVIVPNRRLFENNVINWSYQTPESRLHISVGVAYGSDTTLVTETLLVAARMEPRVLAHPAPHVWFKAFGDSAYDFQLLVWINQPQDFEAIKSSLNFLIEQELSKRGIEVPFPQRDLWVRNPEMLTGISRQIEPSKVMEDIAKPVLQAVQPSAEIAAPTPARKAITKNKALRVLLRQVSYFETCTNAQLRVLIEQGHRQSFPKGQIIFRENDPGDEFYMILSGQVEVFSEKLNQVLATLGVGDFFGEISLLTGAPRSATIRTSEESTLFVVDRIALKTLLHDYQALAEQIAQTLSQRQEVLRELGLLNGSQLGHTEETLFIWMRRRIQTLFGI